MKRVLMVLLIVGLFCELAWAGEKEELNLIIENCQLKMRILQDDFTRISELLQRSQDRLKVIQSEEQKAKEKVPEKK